jgi:hypothetical protein
MRNSNPNREEVADWFEQRLMPVDMLTEILDQAAVARYRGAVILSHFNEPLLDPRIASIAELAKSYNRFSVRLVTNGDLLDESMAAALDGVLNKITISLYLPKGPERDEQCKWFMSLFRKTEVKITSGVHAVVHFHQSAGQVNQQNEPCFQTRRLIVNHRGQYLLCCDDMLGHFDLGMFPKIGLREYWHSEKRLKIVRELEQAGGRLSYPYCRTCPR